MCMSLSSCHWGSSDTTNELSRSYLGFQVPDYTAYAQSLEVFRRLVPIPTAYVLRQPLDPNTYLE